MSVRIDWAKPAIARPIPRILPVSDLPTTPPLRMAISLYPCGARIVRSRLVPAPANTISTPGRRVSISWAIEMPGYRCPPVPPPATTIVSATGESLGRMLRDVQQHPQGAQTDDQARAAVRQERQRDPLRRHQAERHRHVHHRLRHEPGGNSHPEVVTAPVRRPGRRHDAAPEQHAERGDHAAAPMSPSSSEITENTKSVCGSGRKNSFWRLSPTPWPCRPPLATARIDWRTWKPAPSGSSSGFMNERMRRTRYGACRISRPIATAQAPPETSRYFQRRPARNRRTIVRRM